MIFQIVLAIAIVPTAECFSMNPARQYFDVIDRMHQQAQEVSNDADV
jgi:hypothetical protein